MVTKTAKMPTGKEADNDDFIGDARVSQTPPTKADLERVANISLLNAKNETVSFGSLYPKDASHRVLICFIRHFFCGVSVLQPAVAPHIQANGTLQYCQEYLKTLCASITPTTLEALATPTSIVVIGCGSPDLIGFYQEATKCPFSIYAEPTKKIYEELGMFRTLDMGTARPEYQQKSASSVILSSFSQAARSGRNAFKGGDFSQVGGEFLLQGDEVVFCHRMRNTRDHAEIPEIRKAMELAIEPTPDRRKRVSLVGTSIRRSASSSQTREKEPRKIVEEVGEDKENIRVAT
jgi:AhpC/TSA antioxidant enzyme